MCQHCLRPWLGTFSKNSRFAQDWGHRFYIEHSGRTWLSYLRKIKGNSIWSKRSEVALRERLANSLSPSLAKKWRANV